MKVIYHFYNWDISYVRYILVDESQITEGWDDGFRWISTAFRNKDSEFHRENKPAYFDVTGNRQFYKKR